MNEPTKPLPDGWRWQKLGDVCRVVGGSTPLSGTASFWDGDIVWITPTDLGKLADDGLIHSSTRMITQAGYKNCGTEIVPVGSVIMSSRAPIGHLGIAAVPLCTNQGCKSFVPGDAVDGAFLYLALKRAVPQLKAMGSGATFAEVSKTQLTNFVIPLAPLPEQQRLAQILTEQMAAVDRARAAAEAQLLAAKALPAAYLRAVFDSPEARTWPKKTLEDVCRDISDGTHFTPTYIAEGIPFLSVKDVQGKISFENCRFITKQEHKQLCKRCKPERGDVLYTKVGTTGIAKAVDTDIEFSIFVSVALLKLKPEVLPSYLESVLNAPICRAQAENLTQGMANRNLVLRDLKRIKFPVPALEEQCRITMQITEWMAGVEQARKASEGQLAAVNALPAALLRQAFSGEA